MKHFIYLLSTLIGTIGILWSCQKAPEFTFSGPSNIEMEADGNSTSISFTANRDWTVSTSDSWVSVSPSSGSAVDGPIKVSVSCSPNTTYEDRTATITIRMEEFIQTVNVFQPANKGIVLPTKSFNLASGERSIEVEVQANVEYSVSVSADWIKQTGTRGLVSRKLVFRVEENSSNNDREGRITIKALEGNIPDQVISVSQAGKDAIIVKDTSFDMPYGGGAVEVKVEANVEFEVKPGSDWIHYVQTRAMSTSTVCLSVDENLTYSSREGMVEILQKGGSLSHTVIIRQAERIAISSLELNKTNLILHSGESETLIATIKPDNASDPAVSWKSDHPEVATVNDQGLVTAISEGTATITAQAGDQSAICVITVKPTVFEVERAALVELYQALDGDHWTYNANWCSDLPVGQWYGVSTDSYGRVTRLDLSAKGLKGTIPESIGDLVNLTYLNLGWNDDLGGPIPESIGNLVNLTHLAFTQCQMTGTIPESIMNLTKLEDFGIYLNHFDGTISEKLYYSDWWITRYFRMDQSAGFSLKFENIYESTDFSRDGEIKTLQKHTKGPGFPIVITADGFSDRMIADGYFDKVVDIAIESFFKEEPYYTFRDYFDVYSIVAVSKNELIAYDLAFESTFSDWGPSYGIEINSRKVNEYIKKVPGVEDVLSSAVGLLLVNKNNGCVGPFAYMYDTDYALAVVGAGERDAVPHEAGGHGFGKLVDEYYSPSRVFDGDLHEEYHQRGWYLNADDTNDPTRVLWKDFLNDTYYKNEGIGIYQGAYYSNWYKSSQQSIMNGMTNGFNAPSRWAIYQRIKKLAGEEYSFEDFLAYDKNRTKNLVERRPSRIDNNINEKPLLIIHSSSSKASIQR